MTADALGKLVLDIVLRALVKALPGHVNLAVEKSAAPMLETIGALAANVEKVNATVAGYVLRTEFEEQSARTMDAFAKMARAESQKALKGLRIETNAEGFLFLSNELDGVRVALGFRPFQYHGTYESERKYFENDAVTNRGSLWIARAHVEGKAPGTDDGAEFWTLAVKCGKDARPAGNGRSTDG